MIAIKKHIKGHVLASLLVLLPCIVFAWGVISIGSSPSLFDVDAVTFDGTNDYLTLANPFSADDKIGTVLFWFKSNNDGTEVNFISNDSEYFRVYKDTSNAAKGEGKTSGAITTLDTRSSAITVADGWTSVMISWDLGASVSHVYVNNSSDKNELVNNNNLIDYLRSGNIAIGANPSGNKKFNGDLAEFIFYYSYIDLSVAAIRSKIYSGGKPVNPGSDGSSITGSQPEIYLSVRPGDSASAFATNRGSWGNFSITGSLALAATSPSD